MFPLASRRQAKRATGTSWPDQVALARQLSGLAGTAVEPVLTLSGEDYRTCSPKKAHRCCLKKEEEKKMT